MIKKNPDLVRRFTRAFVKGWTYSLTHQQEALEAFLKANPTVDPKYSALKFPEVLKLTQTEDTEKTRDWLFEQGQMGGHAEGTPRDGDHGQAPWTSPRYSPTNFCSECEPFAGRCFHGLSKSPEAMSCVGLLLSTGVKAR